MLARISSAGFVHTNGRAVALCWSRNSRIARSRAATLRCTPRRSCRVVSSANHRSTRFSQELYVQDEVDVQPDRRLGVDALEELLELDRPMAAVQLADDRAGLDVERREQRGRAVAAIVEGAPLGLARLHRQQRRGALDEVDQPWAAAIAATVEHAAITFGFTTPERRNCRRQSTSRETAFAPPDDLRDRVQIPTSGHASPVAGVSRSLRRRHGPADVSAQPAHTSVSHQRVPRLREQLKP